jgi:hypothetical protein
MFRQDVLTCLQKRFDSTNVKSGNKAINVIPGGNLIAADVVAAISHKKYRHYPPQNHNDTVNGIAFYSTAGTKIFNYPKLHLRNGELKNGETKQAFKPMVRIFKNAHNYLANNHTFSSIAPSYFIESLVYSAPDTAFSSDYQRSFFEILNHLLSTDLKTLLVQNQQELLIGPNEWQWNKIEAKRYINALGWLWENWGK